MADAVVAAECRGGRVAEAVAAAVEAAHPYHEFSSEVWNTMSDAAKKLTRQNVRQGSRSERQRRLRQIAIITLLLTTLLPLHAFRDFTIAVTS
jgi:hypothetical protein